MRYIRCAMTSWDLLFGLYTQYINAASPHAPPLRRLGLGNRARNASYSSTGGSSPDSEECSYAPPPPRPPILLSLTGPVGIPLAHLASPPPRPPTQTRPRTVTTMWPAAGGSPLSPPSPCRLNLSHPEDSGVGAFVTAANCTRVVVCPPLPAYLLPHYPLWRRGTAPRKTYIA